MEEKLTSKELLKLGEQAEAAEDFETAMKYYQEAAEAGNTDGMVSIGLLYQNGKGVEASAETTLKWYQKIIDAGDSDGWWFAGTAYEDMEEYEKALAAGNENAQDRLDELKATKE